MVILGSMIDEREGSMSALRRACLLQKQAADVGLDWPEADTVWSRINEELAQVKAASEDISGLGSRLAARTRRESSAASEGREKPEALDHAQSLLVEELGDLLFAVVDVCRTLHVDPCEALQSANDQFQTCFNQLQRKLCEEGKLIGLEPPERLKELWIEARRTAGRPAPVPFWLQDEEEADVRGDLA